MSRSVADELASSLPGETKEIQTEAAQKVPSAREAGARAELERRRDELLRAIADLDAEKRSGELTPEDHQRLRSRYVARAATTLRALQDLGDEVEVCGGDSEAGTGDPDALEPNGVRGQLSHDVAIAGRVPKRRRHRALLLWGIALLSLGVVGLVVVLVAGGSATRLPGQSVSGSVTLTRSEKLVQSLEQAQALEIGGKYVQAMAVYDQVLSSYPHQPEALAYKGWIVRLAGESSGQASLIAQAKSIEQQAVSADPRYPDARFFLGAILDQNYHDLAGALTQFKAFLADKPSSGTLSIAKKVVAGAFQQAGQAPPAAVAG